MAAEEDTNLYIGTHIWRLTCAFGMVYILTEYGVELTICEGPSMLPTIRERGEIIVMDRFTPRWYGLQGGPNGEQRATVARKLQKEHEARLRQRIATASNEDKIIRNNLPPTWYQPRIPVNHLPPEGAWERFWETVTSGISVGDVVVIQHPERIGTVCKRVLALPGDVVTKPSALGQQKNRAVQLRKRRLGEMVIPDGHIWVEGDNPWNSSDSRNYGPVPASLIMGRVLFRVWPLRGNALMERGARPQEDNHPDRPQQSFSGSISFPAGYNGEVFIERPEDLEEEA